MASSLPRTLGELQLYRILQRANLLSYFDAFIQQGGDDVQQLCEAGEDEFLEIMALVGMASKPLHVRRLQKALRDWVTNPTIFNRPLTSLPVSSIPIYKPLETSCLLGLPSSSYERNNNSKEPYVKVPKCAATTCAQSLVPGKLEGICNSLLQVSREARQWQNHHTMETEHNLSPADLGSPASPRDITETLDSAAALSVAECVERMRPSLPKSDFNEVKELLKNNKKLGKMIGHIFEMKDEDPHKEEEVRKYSAIYGRFDSKRKDGKHLTLHELTVNEAAAQLCMKDIALLTRRDELFTLARQISREVTYKYNYRATKFCCSLQESKGQGLGIPDQPLYLRTKCDREELSPKKIKTEVQIENAVATQIKIFHTSGPDMMVNLQKGSFGQNLEDASGPMTSDSTYEPGEKPLNLRISHCPNQMQQMSDGEQSLGKNLCRGFLNLSSNCETSKTLNTRTDGMSFTTSEDTACACYKDTKQGKRKEFNTSPEDKVLNKYSQAALSSMEKGFHKFEPEDVTVQSTD